MGMDPRRCPLCGHSMTGQPVEQVPVPRDSGPDMIVTAHKDCPDLAPADEY